MRELASVGCHRNQCEQQQQPASSQVECQLWWSRSDGAPLLRHLLHSTDIVRQTPVSNWSWSGCRHITQVCTL